jgi:hypothetical protein
VEQLSFEAHIDAAAAVGNPAPLADDAAARRAAGDDDDDGDDDNDEDVPISGVSSEVALQDVLARVAVHALTKLQHGAAPPVPSLAETLLALSSARGIAVAPTDASEAAAARFLRYAPVNVRGVDQLSGDALAAFVENLCHLPQWLRVSGPSRASWRRCICRCRA